MPIYEFICLSCNHKFEELILSQSQNTKVVCPKCKSKNLKKLISKIGGIRFRGSGFYVTDYKNNDKKEE